MKKFLCWLLVVCMVGGFIPEHSTTKSVCAAESTMSAAPKYKANEFVNYMSFAHNNSDYEVYPVDVKNTNLANYLNGTSSLGDLLGEGGDYRCTRENVTGKIGYVGRMDSISINLASALNIMKADKIYAEEGIHKELWGGGAENLNTVKQYDIIVFLDTCDRYNMSSEVFQYLLEAAKNGVIIIYDTAITKWWYSGENDGNRYMYDSLKNTLYLGNTSNGVIPHDTTMMNFGGVNTKMYNLAATTKIVFLPTFKHGMISRASSMPFGNLRQVVFNENIKRIGDSTFSHCVFLDTVNLEYIKTIDYRAFYNTSVKNPTFYSIESIGQEAFCSGEYMGLGSGYVTGTLAIASGDSIVIGQNAFKGNEIVKIDVAESISDIEFGDYCFANNRKGITSVDILSSSSYGVGVFQNDTITRMTLKPISFSENCFNKVNNCASMVFYVPKGEELSVDKDAFKGCGISDDVDFCILPYKGAEPASYVPFNERNDDISLSNLKAYTAEDDCVIYCKEIYTITLDADGGIVGVDKIRVEDGDVYDVPTPVKEEYRFKGWYIGDELITNGEEINIDGDVTLKAMWEKITTEAKATTEKSVTSSPSGNSSFVSRPSEYDDELDITADPDEFGDNKSTSGDAEVNGDKAKIANVSDKGLELHTATFMDTQAGTLVNKGSRKVQNGKKWRDYLPDIVVKDTSDRGYTLIFDYWELDGDKVDSDDEINIDRDVTLYAHYKKIGRGRKYTLSFVEYNKTIEVEEGDCLSEYDVPLPKKSNDTFAGWTRIDNYPVVEVGRLTIEVNGRIDGSKLNGFSDGDVIKLYGIWLSSIENHNITTSETLTMKPIYYTNEECLPYIWRNGDADTVEITSYSYDDVKNVENIYKEIREYEGKAKNVVLLPKNYAFDVTKHKKCEYIRTNLSGEDFIRAANLLFLIHTQHACMASASIDITIEELLKDAVIDDPTNRYGKIGVIYQPWNTDPYIEEKGMYCAFNRKEFIKACDYNDELDSKLDQLIDKLGFTTDTTITDAVMRLNKYFFETTGYDRYYVACDSKSAFVNADKSKYYYDDKNHHVICIGYAKLTTEVFARCGYAARLADNQAYVDTEGGHAFNQLIINGKTLYIDYTWNSWRGPDSRDVLYLDLDSMNKYGSHKSPGLLLSGKGAYRYTTFDQEAKVTEKPSKPTIKKINNKTTKKLIITLKKVNKAKGYQIQYSKNKNFSNYDSINVKDNSAVIKALSKKKKYYIRARAYRYSDYDSLTKIYGDWSDVVSKTTK